MSWAGALDKTGVRSRRLACWSANSQGNAADDGTEAVYVLMPSTPLAYPRVVSRAFALLRVPKVSVPAVQRDFCAEFDSRQLHREGPQIRLVSRSHTCRRRFQARASLRYIRLVVPLGRRQSKSNM